MPLEATATSVATASLADFTKAGLIVPELRERDTAGIINELCQALQREGVLGDVLPFYHGALNRELMATSALECGIAFPHARLNAIKQLQFAFGRTPQPVVWGAQGSVPVQYICLIAVPATDAVGYLHLLAGLARLGQQENLISRIRNALTAEEILAALSGINMRQR